MKRQIKTNIKNKSSRQLPDELAGINIIDDYSTFLTVAGEYNLKVIEFENVYEDTEFGHILVEKNITIGDNT